MRLLWRRALLVLVLFTSGCDTLFPEFFGGSPPDGASTDGGADTDGGVALAGQLCALADLRDLTSCKTMVGGGFRVTVEETRDQTTTDGSGRFSFASLSTTTTTATVAAIDPSGTYLPTIIVVNPNGGILAVPLVSAQALRNAVANAGGVLDTTGGAILGWTLDPSGRAVANANIIANVAAFTDANSPNALMPTDATGPFGLVAFAGMLPTTLSVSVRPLASSGLAANTFMLPVRAGAVTMTLLPLTSP